MAKTEKREIPLELDIPTVHNLLTLTNPSNSELLLSIILLGNSNNEKQKSYSPKGLRFWEEAAKKYDKIFSKFKADTLKKYWRMLDKTGDLLDLAKLVSLNAKEINLNRLSMKELIDCLVKFKAKGGTNFSKFIAESSQKETKTKQNKEAPKLPKKERKQGGLLGKKRFLPSQIERNRVIRHVSTVLQQIIPEIAGKKINELLEQSSLNLSEVLSGTSACSFTASDDKAILEDQFSEVDPTHYNAEEEALRRRKYYLINK